MAKFINPCNLGKRSVDWEISEATRIIMSYYSQYTGFKVDTIVDVFLGKNLSEDPGFLQWIEGLRSNVKIKKAIDIHKTGDIALLQFKDYLKKE